MTTQTNESLIGPPSELISIQAFISSPLNTLHLPSVTTDQPSVHDIQQALHDVWANPTLSAHIIKDHEHTVNAIYTAATKSRKQTRKSYLPDPDTLPLEVTLLQNNLDSVQLSSWRLQTDAAMFMRPMRNTDNNILNQVKPSPQPYNTPDMSSQAILTISCYNRVSWGPSYVSRISQHAFVSSQTLRDVYQAIPCSYRGLGQQGDASSHHSSLAEEGCVICIENHAYGDDNPSLDYAGKLFQHLETSGRSAENLRKRSTSIRETQLASLSVRINEPYWVLHSGNCEHFLVVDQVRIPHSTDPTSGYPITLQITPPLPALCRACHKVPAVLSIAGDVRLGESPCLLCGPCWDILGPSTEQEVVVTPLPVFQTVT